MFDSISRRVRRAFGSRVSASVRGVFAWVWLLGAAIQRVSGVSPRACVWTFRVAGVGDRGMAFRVAGVGNGGRRVCEEDGGRACRVAGVGLRVQGLSV